MRTVDAFLDASHLLSLALLLAFRRAQLPYALLLLALGRLLHDHIYS